MTDYVELHAASAFSFLEGASAPEDLADCATDDLAGWSERKDGETVKHAGTIENLSREDAEASDAPAATAPTEE